jgi:hypothetical protein
MPATAVRTVAVNRNSNANSNAARNRARDAGFRQS